MISLLRLDFYIYHSLSDYEGSLYSKGIKRQEKYLKVLATAHFSSDVVLKGNSECSSVKFHKCRYKGSNFFTKALNLMDVYWNNLKCIRDYKSDLIQISLTASHIRFLFIFIFPLLFPKKKFFLRLTTPAVNKSKIVRNFLDLIVSLNIITYKYVGSSTDNNRKKLWIPDKKYIPLIGAGIDLGFKNRNFNNFNLVYLGTLYSREIWKSVRGLVLFMKDNPIIRVTYDIIGKGPAKDTLELINEIKNNNLENVVTYHGFLPDIEVEKIIERCDFGVAYVPVNDYFQNDSGKTIGYALSGMATIATANKFRSEWVNEEVGILCEDNPESFSKALKELYDNRGKYDSRIIKDHFHQFSEDYVMQHSYIPAIREIIEFY